ncbi:MAG: lipopolysaccharide core heptose(I) kinase RfaP, partial [Victivallaceae bacterium]
YLFKDMGGLWFPAMDAGLSKADCLRFIAEYARRDLRSELECNAAFWQKINQTGEKLYKKEYNRPPRHAFSKR